MTAEELIREDMLKLYPGATVHVEHVNMNLYEATIGHAYLMIDGKAVRQN